MNFFETIYTTLKNDQAKTFIYWTYGSSTGKSLLEKISGIKTLLSCSRTNSTHEVLIATQVGEDLISAILAAMSLGAIPVLPPAGNSPLQLLKLIRRRKIRRIIVSRASFSLRLAAFFTSFKIIELAKAKRGSVNFSLKTLLPHHIGLITHTSGSTGRPKAIYRSHKVLLAQHEVLKQCFPPFEAQVDFPLFPNILLHNLSSGTVSLLPEIKNFDLGLLEEGEIVQQLQKKRPHTLTGNVYYFKKLLKYFSTRKITINGVRALGIGGSPVPEILIKELKEFFPQTEIYIIYGSSEAEPIAIRRCEEAIKDLTYGYCVGNAAPGVEIEIDKTSSLLISDTETVHVGEIKVKGKHVATAGEWLKTGDWGYIKNDLLYLTARSGNERIHNGLQHYQIEQVLSNVDDVEMAAAIIVPDGVEVFYTGRAEETILREALTINFPGANIKKTSKIKNLPVDTRHRSKVLYEKLK
ncbi:AMP-binding protein [Desertivirga arenae]|uniref:AMP-binding protein n=1 Tax=Desertivirga arenae TaxID=2810309 RepID=UPI001A95AC99|nr:AMP-binding protein [Pedobacter sp. SYSU D00823]